MVRLDHRRKVSAFDDVFARARAEGRAALVGYLPAGYPTESGAVDAIRAMVDAGVDIVEIGLPYSDPLMDGPTIQRAVEAALRGGVTTAAVLRTVEAVAANGVATAVMTYWNPVEHYGVDAFARDFAAAGGAGVITPDLLPEEAGAWLAAVDAAKVDPVFLVAPSSTDDRIAATARVCRGFMYAASTMGVTGARDAVSDRAADLVTRARTLTDIPIGVGLGVSSGAQAAEVASYADAVIVGSALVRCLLDPDDAAAGLRALSALTQELATGVRGGG
jgi:tryptophan synthase alpha chain